MKKIAIVMLALFGVAIFCFRFAQTNERKYGSVEEVRSTFADNYVFFGEICEIFSKNIDFWSNIHKERGRYIYQNIRLSDRNYFTDEEWEKLTVFFQEINPYMITLTSLEENIGIVIQLDFKIANDNNAVETYTLFYISSYGNLQESEELEQYQRKLQVSRSTWGEYSRIDARWSELIW